eukprot:788558-Rhodomonas_salina.1
MNTSTGESESGCASSQRRTPSQTSIGLIAVHITCAVLSRREGVRIWVRGKDARLASSTARAARDTPSGETAKDPTPGRANTRNIVRRAARGRATADIGVVAPI